MKVLLCHIDGALPNIALMRIAAHHRDRGDDVELRKTSTVRKVEPMFGDNFDRVYGSIIFQRSRPVAMRLREIYPRVKIGGTGWSCLNKVLLKNDLQ